MKNRLQFNGDEYQIVEELLLAARGSENNLSNFKAQRILKKMRSNMACAALYEISK